MHTPRTLLAFSLWLAAGAAHAGSLLECQDPNLATLDTQQMFDALRSVGGESCNLHSQSWGDVVSCEQTHARAFGLPVKELSAEIHQDGMRSLSIVTTAGDAQTRKRLKESTAAEGLSMEVQSREDGATTVRCIAAASSADANSGGIFGLVPELPPGASSWQVCAQPASGKSQCVTAAVDLSYRIEGLQPGEYGLVATPVDATDRLVRAILVRSEPIGLNAQGGPKVVAERINLRSGAQAQAGDLQLLRMPPED